MTAGKRLIELEVLSIYWQVSFSGCSEMDIPLVELSDIGRAAPDGVFIYTGVDNESYRIDLLVGEELSAEDEVFFETEFETDAAGIEVANVLEASEEGSEGFIGQYFELPWQGRSKMLFSSISGFEKDLSGKAFPRDLKVSIVPK